MPRTDRRSSREFDLVVIGEVNPDIILSGDVMPEFGQVEKIVESGAIRIGSSSAIFACGAARLGLNVMFWGMVGDDLFGHFMLDSMRARGVNVDSIRVDPDRHTGFSVILATGADRAILTYPGVMPDIRLRDLDLEQLNRVSHLHMGGYYLLDALRPDVTQLFAAARQRGATVSLDTNYDPREDWRDALDTLPLLDMLLVNDTEAQALTGCQTPAEAIDVLAERVPLVAVKQGAEGALARQGTTAHRVAPPPVTVKDTVGAGDSFDAGFIYGYLAGWSLDCCLSLGAACGSLSTRQHGGTDAQPTLDEARAAMPTLAICR